MSRSRSELVTLDNEHLTLFYKAATSNADRAIARPNNEITILNQNRKEFLKFVIYSVIE